MKRFLTIRYTTFSFNFSMLLLRLLFGGTMLFNHGLPKLVGFTEMQAKFSFNFLGMGSKMSLIMLVFAEFFCSIFVIIGLFTRFTVVPLILSMAIAFFMVHKGIFQEGEMAALYCGAFMVLLFCGPGKASVDSLIG